MRNILPEYPQLDLYNCPLFEGYYSLGLILKYRPDIALVPLRLARRDQWQDADINYALLKQIIDKELSNDKKVFIVPWEEDIMGEPDPALTELLNSYQDRLVYLITEMDAECQKIYTFQHQICCNILELPFVLVNDAIVYAAVRPQVELSEPNKTEYNYLCMVGRPEEHKYSLVKSLIDNELAEYGLITVAGRAPIDIKSYCKINLKTPRYEKSVLLTKHRKEAAQLQINGLWCSSNVENYLHIETTYNMPLIVHSESTVGIFPATEKSMWPVLLGKLYLIHGHPGIMSWIQRFHDVDQRQWANVDFDSINGYTKENHAQRLQTMIESNRQLITSAAEIYQQLKPELEEARSTFVQNLYSFFASQIDSI